MGNNQLMQIIQTLLHLFKVRIGQRVDCRVVLCLLIDLDIDIIQVVDGITFKFLLISITLEPNSQ